MSKVTIVNETNVGILGKDIVEKTYFTGRIGEMSGLFIKGYRSIMRLRDGSEWDDQAIVMDFKEVDVKIIVNS